MRRKFLSVVAAAATALTVMVANAPSAMADDSICQVNWGRTSDGPIFAGYSVGFLGYTDIAVWSGGTQVDTDWGDGSPPIWWSSDLPVRFDHTWENPGTYTTTWTFTRYGDCANRDLAADLLHVGGTLSGPSALTNWNGWDATYWTLTETVVVNRFGPPPAPPALQVTKAVTIKGKARVGKKVHVSRARFSPAPEAVTYRWYRSGNAIKKATHAKYKLKAKDQGKRIKVRVTAYRDGYTSATTVSPSVKAKKAKH